MALQVAEDAPGTKFSNYVNSEILVVDLRRSFTFKSDADNLRALLIRRICWNLMSVELQLA